MCVNPFFRGARRQNPTYTRLARYTTVEPIVETAVKTDADLLRVRELVGEDLFFKPIPAPTDDDGSSSSGSSSSMTCQGGEGLAGGDDGSGSGEGGGAGMETRAQKKARRA